MVESTARERRSNRGQKAFAATGALLAASFATAMAWSLAPRASAQPPEDERERQRPAVSVTFPEAPPPSVDLQTVLRGDGTGMDADQAARAAVASAPSVDGARQTLSQVRAGADRAVFGFVPRFGVSASYTRLPTQGGQLISEDDRQTIDRLSDDAARQLWDRHAQVLEDRYQLLGTLTFLAFT